LPEQQVPVAPGTGPYARGIDPRQDHFRGRGSFRDRAAGHAAYRQEGLGNVPRLLRSDSRRHRTAGPDDLPPLLGPDAEKADTPARQADGTGRAAVLPEAFATAVRSMDRRLCPE